MPMPRSAPTFSPIKDTPRHAAPGTGATEHHIKPATFAWVVFFHLLALALLTLLPQLHAPGKSDPFIEMVALGELDPGEGNSLEQTSSGQGPISPLTPSHAPAPLQPPKPPSPAAAITPPTPAPAPPIPTPQPTSQAQPVTPPKNTVPPPSPTPTPTPAKSKPAPVPVKVNLTPVKRGDGATAPSGAGTSTPQHTQPGGTGSGQGLSASEIKARLAGKVGNAGIPGGTGSGRPGDPDGDPNAEPYKALIKVVLTKAWEKPSIPEDLKATLRIRVKPDGTLVFEGLEKSSGNAEMDASVIGTVHRVGKLPQALPPGLGNPDLVVPVIFELN
ncbi:MAG: energy transducer TonB [Candidatus Methylacidiphilales bacterium]|nr:energy transducer TonB [Candidatus Methylacidiphilales bacterium]